MAKKSRKRTKAKQQARNVQRTIKRRFPPTLFIVCDENGDGDGGDILLVEQNLECIADQAKVAIYQLIDIKTKHETHELVE